MFISCDTIPHGAQFPEIHLGPGHGANVAPVLRWSDAPEGTRAFAITLTDDDAPGYQHWLMVVDGSAHGVDAFNHQPTDIVGQGSRLFGYEGPCPPVGTHHYVFTVTALSAMPQLRPGFTADELDAQVKATMLAQAQVRATHNAGLTRQLQAQGGRVVGFLRRLSSQSVEMAA